MMHIHFFGKKLWSAAYTQAILSGLGFYIASLVINYYTTIYAFHRASVPVTDIVLSNLRFYDVDGLIIFCTLFILLFTAYLCLIFPKKLPFILKSLALFIFIRSIFISLTHIAPFTPHVILNNKNFLVNIVGLAHGEDLFFSGHTGMPFLGALIFWSHQYLRTLYLCGAIVLGILMLLGHLHYSIDVFAAFFITYSVYRLAAWMFKTDLKLAKD